MVTTATRISVEKLGDALGAEVRGVNLSQPMSDEDFQQISDAWFENLHRYRRHTDADF